VRILLLAAIACCALLPARAEEPTSPLPIAIDVVEIRASGIARELFNPDTRVEVPVGSVLVSLPAWKASGCSGEVVAASWPHQAFAEGLADDFADAMLFEHQDLAVRPHWSSCGRPDLAGPIFSAMSDEALHIPKR
jgi:hypothetical protein